MTREMRQLLADREALVNKAKELIDDPKATAQELNNNNEKLTECMKKIKDQAVTDGINVDLSNLEEVIGSLEDSKVKNSSTNLKIYNKSQDLIKAYENKEGLDLGKYVRGAITGNWQGAEIEKQQFKALGTSTGQVLIPSTLSAKILAGVMNKSLIYGSGVPMVDMPSGNLTIAKVTKNPTTAFKGEGQVAAGVTFDSAKGTYTTDDINFAGLTLKAKTVYGLCKVTNEVLASAQNLSQVLEDAFSAGLADGIDKACIYGDGGTTDNPGIKGIAITDGINNVAMTGDALVSYKPFIQAIGAIRGNNGEPTTWGLNAKIDELINELATTEGQPINPPKVIDNLRKMISNNLRSNLGTGTNESESLIYDPASMIIGQQVGVSFVVSNQALDAMATGCTYFSIATMLDFAVLRPEFIARITGLK